VGKTIEKCVDKEFARGSQGMPIDEIKEGWDCG